MLWTQNQNLEYTIDIITRQKIRQPIVIGAYVYQMVQHTPRKIIPRSLFSTEVAGNELAVLKRRLVHGCLPVNFAKFLSKPFFWNTSGRLLLIIQNSNSNYGTNDCTTPFIPIK